MMRHLRELRITIDCNLSIIAMMPRFIIQKFPILFLGAMDGIFSKNYSKPNTICNPNTLNNHD